MEIFEPETGALRAACMEEIGRCLARGWSWGVTAKLCARKWGAELSAAELKKRYADTLRLAARTPERGEYIAAALESKGGMKP
jgi:hypothetical protein